MRYLSEQSEPRRPAEPGRPARWAAGRDRAEARPANAEAGPGWPARRPEAGSANPEVVLPINDNEYRKPGLGRVFYARAR
jgi:hypothetical protein